ncbi:MAG: hypothetical protein JO247_07755 [Chloroflexi bacterium]|nr:hypothetical protein [Chloroflexota bacterium]
MYLFHAVHYPALGKIPELRAALEERAAALRAAGTPHRISQQLFADEPALVDSVQCENLAAVEAQLDSRTTSEWRAGAQKIAALLARPVAPRLERQLVPPTIKETPKFILRMTYVAAPGRGPALRQALERHVEGANRLPGALGNGLNQLVVSTEGPTFSWSALFTSLSHVDEFLGASASDAQQQASGREVQTLIGAAPRQTWFRVLLPFRAG